MIAINAPADTPRLDEVALRLSSLASLVVTRESDGSFTFSQQA